MPNKNKHIKTASLSGKVVSTHKVASLKSAMPQDKSVSVDFEKGIIYNCAVMTVGPARGHGFMLDQTSLEQSKALLSEVESEGGTTMRFKHPEQSTSGGMTDALGSITGQLRNPRIVGDSLRGDAYLGDYADDLPGLGNARKFLLKLAASNPGALGLSTVIAYDEEYPEEEESGSAALNGPSQPFARIVALDYVDFVGRPAANPRGLLSEKDTKTPTNKIVNSKSAKLSSSRVTLKGGGMNRFMKALLANMGCDPSASDEDVRKFYDELSDEDRTKVDNSFKVGSDDADPWTAPEAPKTPEAPALMSAKEIADLVATTVTAALANKETPKKKEEPKEADLKEDPNEALIKAAAVRVKQIERLGATLGMEDADIREAKSSKLSIADIQNKFLDILSTKAKSVNTVKVGDDKRVSSLCSAIPDAIMLRNGYNYKDAVKRDPSRKMKEADLAEELSKKSMLQMFQQYLVDFGANRDQVYRLSNSSLADLLGSRKLRNKFGNVASLAESTSDFPSLLLDAMNKTMRFSYRDATPQWSNFFARNTAPDFKTINRPAMSEAPSMTARDEGKEIVYQVITDSNEKYNLREWSNGIILTRRAIINDDMNAFATIPTKFAATAGRLEDDQAFGIFTGNAALADGYALMGTQHVNYIAQGSGGPPSIAQMQLIQSLMMGQRGPGGVAVLDLMPTFLVVPTALWASTKAFINSTQQIPTISTTSAAPVSQGNVNPYAGMFQVITSNRLDKSSTTNWYALTDYREGKVDTAEMCFLADEPEPFMKQETDFDTDDVKYAMRHTLAIKALDYRGFVFNYGA